MYENPPVSTMRNCGFFRLKTPLVVALLACQPNRLWMQKIASQPDLLINPTRFLEKQSVISTDGLD
jgi:hypothetical protein